MSAEAAFPSCYFYVEMMATTRARKSSGGKSGRPPKFRGASRPITVTLPEDTLARLASIDADRARAIVKATHAALAGSDGERNPVELVEVAPDLSIVIVAASRVLRTISWLRLIEIAPLRYMLAIPQGTAVDSLELTVIELLEGAQGLDDREVLLLTQLRDLMRSSRRRGDLSKAEILLVDTAAKPPRGHG
jgi:hypothetical protein